MSAGTVRRQRLTAISNVLMLYAGKSSGVLVAFVFLPLYSRLLGAQQFGMVAVILSLQALLMMLDLGMSVIVSRDVAAGQTDHPGLARLIGTAEASLSGFYGLLMAGTVAYKVFAGGFPAVGLTELLAILGVFWLLVLQNVNYSALLAMRSYGPASAIQVAGGVLRAGATAYVLNSVSATLTAFALTQLVFSGIQYWSTRVYLRRALTDGGRAAPGQPVTLANCLSLLGRSKAIMLSSAAGAAAMQLDKPIVSIFMTAAEVAPYFLAVTLSAAPLGVLAAPVAQYFQPRITNDIARDNHASFQRNMKHFIWSTVGVVLVPTLLLLVFNEAIVNVWLGHSGHKALVTTYCRVLLLANGLAALGYIPYVLIIARQEFHFQAQLSLLATLFVLGAVALSASHGSILLVCWSYVAYSAIVFVGFITRLASIPGFRRRDAT